MSPEEGGRRYSPEFGEYLALYETTAVKGSRPEVVILVHASITLHDVEQGRIVTVYGWPTVGRAVAVDIDDLVVFSIYPCISPVFRPMKFR